MDDAEERRAELAQRQTACLSQIFALVHLTEERRGREWNEMRAAGKRLTDDPVQTSTGPDVELEDDGQMLVLPPGTSHAEIVTLGSPRGLVERSVRYTSLSTYRASWLRWPAYAEARRLCGAYGVDESVLYQHFIFVPGVMAFVTRDGADGQELLVCLRSAQIGGTYAGQVSTPAGLLRPGETLGRGLQRQLLDEAGLAFRGSRRVWTPVPHPDAPQTVYCAYYGIEEVWSQERLAEPPSSWEAANKRFVWVPVDPCIRDAYFDKNTRPLAKHLATQGIQLSGGVKLAPDFVKACQRMFLWNPV